MLPLFYFFFHFSSHPQILHSSPTRRSSDLKEYVLIANSHRTLTRLDASEIASAPAMTHASDRKSTRLNSSHVSISYAVFCLKKKNESDVLLYQLKLWIATVHIDIILVRCYR